MNESQFETLWALNPVGNKEATFNYILWYLDEGHEFKGKPLTFEIILQQYKNHIDYLEQYNTGDVKYIKKEKEIQSIMDFMRRGTWAHEYGEIRKGRDDYLFGEFSDDHLTTKLKAFKQKFKQ